MHGALAEQVGSLLEKPDGYIAHDHLEENNDACYFHQFMDRVREHDMQYLGDAMANSTVMDEYWPQPQALLRRFADDRVRLEQVSDFLRNRSFRRSLLCRSGVALQLISAERVKSMHIMSPLRRQASYATVKDNQPMRFGGFGEHAGSFTQTSRPTTKATLVHLQEMHPRCIAWADIERHARQVVKLPESDYEASFRQTAAELLRLWMLGLMDLSVTPPRFSTVVHERPLVPAIIRYQTGVQDSITTLRHEMAPSDERYRRLIRLLDGTRTIEQIVRLAMENDVVVLPPQADAVTRLSMAREKIGEALKAAAIGALLVEP